jgi:hypothetical protein
MEEDDQINVTAELAAANKQLAIDLTKSSLPLEMQMRTIALTIAQRHCGDTTVKEGALYNALKMDNKPTEVLTVDHVIRAALIFERYLWGQWSRGIAEEAMNATSKEFASHIEAELRERGLSPDLDPDDPERPTSAGT